MNGNWGGKLRLTLFGESHGPAIGMVMDGLPAGLSIDLSEIQADLDRRAPGRSELATSRREPDRVRVLSGLYQGKTNGAPLCGVVENTNTRSGDYAALARLMRPGHADYPAWVKHRGHADPRGGGAFSGRLTAPVVFAGAVARQVLAPMGIMVGAHITQIGSLRDAAWQGVEDVTCEGLSALRESPFPLLDPTLEQPMRDLVLQAKAQGDSVGGAVACGAAGVPAGWGEPFFGSVETVLSSLLFSIPAVKAVEFGAGRAFAGMQGSEANDPYVLKDGRVRTVSNHNGGVLGGITTGMPLLLWVAVKPTPSIALPQRTVDVAAMEEAELRITGRHDPCIVPRAVPVVEAAVWTGLLALALEGGAL